MKLGISQKMAGICVSIVLVACTLLLFTAAGSPPVGSPAVTIISPTKQAPIQTNLVSDGSVAAVTVDPSLINPWGMSYAPGGEFWVSDNGTGVSTLYNGAGAKAGLTVTIPPAPPITIWPSPPIFQTRARKAMAARELHAVMRPLAKAGR